MPQTLTATSDKLTGRQLEILGLVAKGFSNPDICKLLSISINTVKIHVAAILQILEVTNRTEAAFVYQSLIASEEKTELASRAKAAQRIGCPAIAVVPFEERSSADDGFAVGLVEDLIGRIASWRWFPVIAYASSSKYNLREHTVSNIGTALQVAYIITGGVRRIDSRARINVSLLSVTDGETIWSDHFDCELTDVFAVQDEITRKIVARIAPELIAMEARTPTANVNVSLDAWQHTARGLWHLSRRDLVNAQKGRADFEAAIAIDANYGLAWYGKAQYHYQMLFEQWTDDHVRERASFMQAVERCAQTDPNSAGSHMMRAVVKMISGDVGSAYAHLQQAVALNPSLGQAVGLLGQLKGMMGSVEEGMVLLEDALRLNPQDATTWIHVSTLAMSNFALARYQEGIALAQRAIALKRDAAMPHAMLIACLQCNDQHVEASHVVTQLRAINPAFRVAPLMQLMTAVSPSNLGRFRDALLAAGVPA